MSLSPPAAILTKTRPINGFSQPAHRSHKDAAVQTSLMLRMALKLALRQTKGLLASVLTLMGLTLSAPDRTTVSRRAVGLPVIQPAHVPPGPLHVLIDSTGLQVYGAGQWVGATPRGEAHPGVDK